MSSVFLDTSDFFTNSTIDVKLSAHNIFNKSTNWNLFSNKTSSLNRHWLTTNFMLLIPMYGLIFFMSVIGNSLVIYILVHMKRMRTETNLYLLNLAISDLFLGVFCMPFTLVGTILRDFVFGDIMCKLLQYLQATSVTVSAWTLVAISVERFLAICRPTQRLKQNHRTYKSIIIIFILWIFGLISMSPTAFLSQRIPTSSGRHKCREIWPFIEYEKVFNLSLCVFLFIIPLVVLTATYSMISLKLWKGLMHEQHCQNKNSTAISCILQKNTHDQILDNKSEPETPKYRYRAPNRRKLDSTMRITFYGQPNNISEHEHDKKDSIRKQVSGLKRSAPEKKLQSKKRVIKMLFVIVLEFFICWTPLYVINTITLFDPKFVYDYFGYTTISYFHLLAYSSSCCNPITYCFMNSGFRKAFKNLFNCTKTEVNRKMSLDVHNSCTIAGESSAIVTSTFDSSNKTELCSSSAFSSDKMHQDIHGIYVRSQCPCSRNQYVYN